MYPNWNLIQNLNSRNLRHALFTAHGEERLRLEKYFREYYSEDVRGLRVPGSLLLEQAMLHYEQEGYAGPELLGQCYMNWYTDVLFEEDILTTREWHEDQGDRIPAAIRRQFVGHPLTLWMTVRYKSDLYLLSNVFTADLDRPVPGTILPDGEYNLALTPLRFVDTAA